MKERITITIDKGLLKWLDKKVDSRIFATRSHALEFLAKSKMNSEKISADFYQTQNERIESEK